MVKIAVAGAHGVGKSTLAHWLGDQLHLVVLPTPGRWMAKRSLPVNEEATVASQTLAWLLQQEFEAEHTSWIAPRSLVDVWAYAALAAERDTTPLAQSTFARLTAATERGLDERYSALLYLPPSFPLQSDDVRSGDVRFQRRLDELIHEALLRWKVPHLKIDPTLPNANEEALRYVTTGQANVIAGADAV